VDTILLLAGVGFLLLLTEMFLPGGVLGAFGCVLLVVAIIVGYMQLGPGGGTLVLCAVLVCGTVGFCVAMALFPRTAVGRKMTLAQEPSQGGGRGTQSLPDIGGEGVALTPLRPAGRALIEGIRFDVIAEGEFVEIDEPVVVTGIEATRISVRKKS
jgi:membrane-bound serine protease (ClpP class)